MSLPPLFRNSSPPNPQHHRLGSESAAHHFPPLTSSIRAQPGPETIPATRFTEGRDKSAQSPQCGIITESVQRYIRSNIHPRRKHVELR